MFSEHERLFRKGVEEFNGGYFFEAHETWETLWRETRGPQRLFFQGLIQTAAGLYHFSCGNYRGACSQMEKALQKLGQYLPAYHGVDTQRLVERVRDCLRDAELLRKGEEVRPRKGNVPSIELQH